MSALPARVRVSRLPLPPSPAVLARLNTLFADHSPTVPIAQLSGTQLSAGAVALAGGKIIGAALSWPGGEALALESGWRGRGIEEALSASLQEPDPNQRRDTQAAPEQP
ncbi:hypothetical protein [Deinococcus sp.]|uniref:hypothetical protein n=1 Tax=Deinococcus sp. TaxID=47478 RepID=UPI003B59E150